MFTDCNLNQAVSVSHASSRRSLCPPLPPSLTCVRACPLVSEPQGNLRVTVQGEIIEQQFADREVCFRTFDLYTSAVLEASLDPPAAPKVGSDGLAQLWGVVTVARLGLPHSVSIQVPGLVHPTLCSGRTARLRLPHCAVLCA